LKRSQIDGRAAWQKFYAATLVRRLGAGAALMSLPSDATMKSMNFLNLAGTWLREG
jgi:hypothetical protein